MKGKLKYKIKSMLATLPHREEAAKKRQLRECLGHSPQMFMHYLNARHEDTLDFKGMELPTIANVLGCNIEDLYTPVVGQSKE